MNRILFALAAVLALLAMPNTSNACGLHGCKARVHHVRVAPAPVVAPARVACCRVDVGARFAAMRADISARFAKVRAQRAATGAAFRASLAQMFARVPRPVVAAAPARPCTLFTRVARPAPVVVAAPRKPCGLFSRHGRHAGCLHRA